jgi:hypothetical protein
MVGTWCIQHVSIFICHVDLLTICVKKHSPILRCLVLNGEFQFHQLVRWNKMKEFGLKI